MRRGFITLATGNEAYFKLARNLLHSYKVFSPAPYPFAIITDRRNAYTDEFDDVIVLENASSSWVDKLSLLVRCPYDETIFIDADCLAYTDLNQYWGIFDKADDFSCFGALLDLDSDKGWFKKDDIGEFRHAIKFIPNMHGGIYFIRNGDRCKRMHQRSQEIARDYQSYKFAIFNEPCDEPILALCMALYDCLPVEMFPSAFVFRPLVEKLKVDILEGHVSCIKRGAPVDGAMLVHWQTDFTGKPLYRFEADKVELLYEKARMHSGNGPCRKLSVLERLLYKAKVKLLYYAIIDRLNVITAQCRKVICPVVPRPGGRN